MKKLICLIFLLFIFAFTFSCCETECCEEVLPSFEPINYNENVIFFNLSDWNENRLVAIDTSCDKVLQKYDFEKNNISWILFDNTISNKIYIFSEPTYFFVLDPSSGILSKKKTNYGIMDIVYLENKILLQKNIVFIKGVPVDCNLYNVTNDNFENYTIPEGSIGTYIDQNIVFDNKSYLPIMYDGQGSSDNTHPTVYNITDKKILDFYPERNYVFFHFVGDKYLYAYHEETYFADVYEVTSFEPVNAKIIYTENYDVIGLRIFEDDDFLCVIDQLNEYVQITKRNKSDYSIVAQKEITKNYQPGGVPYFKNNHFWVTSLDDDGAYKISKDLEITVVK